MDPGPARLLVASLAMGAVAAPYLLRAHDDNRLTSWAWVFAGVHPARLYLLVLAGVGAAWAATRGARPAPPRRPATVLFAAASAVGVLSWRAPELVVDAARYFTQAKAIALHGVVHFLEEWGRAVQAWTDLPLAPLLYGLLFALVGEARWPVQALTTLLFAGSVALTYRLGAELWDEEVGFTAGALLLASPYLVVQVPAMLVDVPSMFFLQLALCATVALFRRGGGARVAWAAACLCLALACKYSLWLLLSAVPVAWAVLRRERAPGATLRAGALLALGVGAAVGTAALVRGDLLAAQWTLLAGYQAPGLRRWGESFASTFLFQVHPFLSAAALLSVALAVKRRDARWLVVAWPALVLAALQVRRARYWVPAFPALALMAAYGLQAIRAQEVRRFAVACAVAASLVVAVDGYLPFLERTSAANLARAGAYLDHVGEERVEVFTIGEPGCEVNPAVAVPLLDLFTRKRLVHAGEATAPPSPERLAVSSLRFTWEYRLPPWYASAPGGGDAAVVVISDSAGAPLPEGLQQRLRQHRLARLFDADEGVFGYRTAARVYRPALPPTVLTIRDEHPQHPEATP